MIENRKEIKLKIGQVLKDASSKVDLTFADIVGLLNEMASEFETFALKLPLDIIKPDKP